MRYELEEEEGTFVETEKAAQSWDEGTRWNGNNHISYATSSQWEHETLYLSTKGFYYVVRISQWQGSCDTARRLTEAEATAWLLRNNKNVPEALQQFAQVG